MSYIVNVTVSHDNMLKYREKTYTLKEINQLNGIVILQLRSSYDSK